MNRSEFKLRMQSLKSYRELNPGKGYWDWKVELFEEGGEKDSIYSSPLLSLTYKGPTYDLVLESLKKDDPTAYNRLAEARARELHPTNEIVRYIDANGNYRAAHNISAGFVSGTDPAGKFIVEQVALSKPINFIGENILKRIPSSIIAKLRHPTYTKVYHGSPNKFSLKQGRPYSESDIGLHVSPNKEIAETFSKDGGHVMEGYIPKHNMETIDIGLNDYTWISNKVLIPANPPSEIIGYPITLPDTYRLSLLLKYGADPIVKKGENGWVDLFTNKDVIIPLRDETWKGITPNVALKADDIVARGNSAETVELTLQINKEAALLLSDNGIKVIKYHNENPLEIGGESYAITDPSIIYVPTLLKWNNNIGNIIGSSISLGDLFEYSEGGEIPPDNSPVHVNPITNRPLANGAILPVFDLEDAANFTPVGDALSVRDAYIAASNNDWLNLTLAGLGILPFVPRLGKRSVPTVNRGYMQLLIELMEKERAKRLQVVDDFYNLQDQVYESIIDNEDAFRRAVKADNTAGTNYVGTYSDLLRSYSKGSSKHNEALPLLKLTNDIPDVVKAQVDPNNLDWIRINRRYTDLNELDPVFLRMNPGLVRHELGHIVDEKSNLDYIKKLGDRSKFESEERLKEMYPSSYKRIRDYLLNGSEIKSHMNEFRDFLFLQGDRTLKETPRSMRQKLDKYKDLFKNLNILFDSYKSKKQFIKDYNSVPIVQNNQRSNKSNYA